jgi:hypothetical protein
MSTREGGDVADITTGKRIVVAVWFAIMATLASLVVADTAHATFPCGWPNDPPNDHYHLKYTVNTKHDYQYSYGDDYGNVIRVWYVKKDRDGDGAYRYDHTEYVNCGKYA